MTKKKGDIWMPFYISDYLGDTMHLTTAQHGAYILLLMGAWKRGASLPDNDEQLAQIAKCDAKTWRAIRPVLEEFWDIADGTWSQKRLTKEFTKAGGIVDKRKQAGKAGAAKRWGKEDDEPDGKRDGKPIANAMANGMAKGIANECQTGSQTPWQADAPSQSHKTKERIKGGGSTRARDSDSISPPTPPDPRFRMHSGWQPSVHCEMVCQDAGMAFPRGPHLAAVVAEFIAFWRTQPREASDAEWEHVFVKSLKKEQLYAAGGPRNADRSKRAEPRTATERNVRAIAALTGRDREAERDVDGIAVRVD